MIHSQDNLYLTYSRTLVVLLLLLYMDLSLEFVDTLFDWQRNAREIPEVSQGKGV